MEKMIYALSSVIFRKHRFIPKLNGQPKQPLPLAAQGQFWSMHDTLFAHQQKLENGYLVEYANDLGLDIPQFLKELSKQVHIDRVNEDIESGCKSGITATPALFINNIRYTGRWKMAELMTAIVAASH